MISFSVLDRSGRGRARRLGLSWTRLPGGKVEFARFMAETGVIGRCRWKVSERKLDVDGVGVGSEVWNR